MLALRIVRGSYEPIPKCYSAKLSLLLKKLLNPDTNMRPSINKILKIDIIAARAKQLLAEDDYIQEFSHTVLHGKFFDEPYTPPQPEKPSHKVEHQSSAPASGETSSYEKFKSTHAKSKVSYTLFL